LVFHILARHPLQTVHDGAHQPEVCFTFSALHAAVKQRSDVGARRHPKKTLSTPQHQHHHHHPLVSINNHQHQHHHHHHRRRRRRGGHRRPTEFSRHVKRLNL
jgi:hypothetical protein